MTNQVKKEVLRWLAHYMHVFNLQDWKINVIYSKELESSGIAEIESNYPYMFANLTINLEALIKYNDTRKVIKHEMLHLLHAEHSRMVRQMLEEDLDSPEWDRFQDACERLVTKLERIIK